MGPNLISITISYIVGLLFFVIFKINYLVIISVIALLNLVNIIAEHKTGLVLIHTAAG